MFAPADTWVSTEYLFRRDEDGDYWLVDTRAAVIHTARGPVFAATVNDAFGWLGAVDMAVTYAVTTDTQTLAVTALALRSGGSVTAADLSEGAGRSARGRRPRHRARRRRYDADRDLPPASRTAAGRG